MTHWRLLATAALALAAGCRSRSPEVTGPAPAPLTSDAAEDGARLRARRVTLGGTSLFIGWRDGRFGFPCWPGTASDGAIRCLPPWPYTSPVFADAGCTEPAAVVQRCDAPIGYVTIYTDRSNAFHVYPLGAAIDAVYLSSWIGCTSAELAPGQVPYRLGPEVPASELAAFQRAVGPAAGGLQEVRLVADDGAWQHQGLQDAAGGFSCRDTGQYLDQDPLPGPRCLPDHATSICDGMSPCWYPRPSPWADPACSVPAVWADHSLAPPAFAFEYVASGYPDPVRADNTGRVHPVDAAPTTAYGDTGQACGPVSHEFGFSAHVLGPAMPPESFVPGQEGQVGDGRLAVPVVDFPGGRRIRTGGVGALDLTLGGSCVPALAADGVVRCLPGYWSDLTREGFGPYGRMSLFADDQCTRPLAYLPDPLAGLVDDRTCPPVTRVYRVPDRTWPYQGPVYGGDPCAWIPVYSPYLYLVGEELPPALFAEVQVSE